MEFIQSSNNELIKEVKKLKEKKHRVEKQEFIVEGFRFVNEAIESSFEAPYVFISEMAKDKWERYHLQEQVKSETKVFWVSETVLKSICSTETPQGIVAVVKNKQSLVSTEQGFYLLVDKVQDPGNLGTLIRTAHAAGALGVILTKGTVDVYNEKALRATMGSIFHIPIIEDKELIITKGLITDGFKLVASLLDTEDNFYDVNLKGKVIIAVGSEASGVSEEVTNICTNKVKVPMPGGAESLNVAIAGSIMIYEAVRQRNSK